MAKVRKLSVKTIFFGISFAKSKFLLTFAPLIAPMDWDISGKVGSSIG